MLYKLASIFILLIIGIYPFIYLIYKRIEFKSEEIPFFSYIFKGSIYSKKAFEFSYQLWYFLFLIFSFLIIFRINNFHFNKAFFQFLIIQFFIILLWWMTLENIYEKFKRDKVISFCNIFMWANTIFLFLLIPFIVSDRLNYKKNLKDKRENIAETDAGKEIERSISYIGNIEGVSVREIMVPRMEVIAIKEDATLSDLYKLFMASKHSRIPVYAKNLDNIIGIINLKDFIAFWSEEKSNESISSLIRQVLYVPETKRISTILKDFKENESHVAIVLNEYGGTSGIVTMHDVMEKIIGEIKDEYDKEEEITEVEGYYVMSGKTDIEKVEEALGIKIEEGDYDTISGYIFNIIGRVPHTGEKIKTSNMIIEILSASDRKINKVRIKKL